MAEQLVPIKAIHDNPYQGREQYDDIEGLGRAIAVHGLQQMPKARQNGKGMQLKFGHRRKRAFEWLSANWKKEGLPERYSGYTLMPLDVGEFSDREMFDAVVVENVHRDDLKPTEEAHLLKQYQETFPDATSREIGLVFNKNEATVRGMVRLLDLPGEAQKALDEGKITQGTARELLSMQKVASAEVVAATVSEIQKSSGVETPEEVIEDMVSRQDNVVEMWNERSHKGQPRSGRHGWLLSMKNFPNKLLPELDEETAAELTEEQAEHLSNPPACSACPFHTTVRGSHYCGVKICHSRKTEAWHAYLLDEASKQLGIPIYDPADGVYRVLDYMHVSLFEKKGKDLRLIARHKVNGYHWQNFKGVNDDVFLVVATGAALDKIKSTRSGGSQGGKKSEREKADMRALKIYRARRKELMWEYTGAAEKIFESVPLSVLEVVDQWKWVGVDDRIPNEYVPTVERVTIQAAYLRRSIIWALIKEHSSHYSREALTDQLAAFQELIGVKPPKALIKQVETWDAEIEAAAQVVAVETPAPRRKKGKIT